MTSNESIPSVTGTNAGGLWRSLAAAACGTIILSAQPSAAAQMLVDFTVHETNPTTQGEIVGGQLEGCPEATVWTVNPGSSQSGPVVSFNGSKKIDCGAGNSLSIAFKVRTSECRTTAVGAWKVTSGTGLFASAKGQGRLVGTYTLGDGPGTYCNKDGINDRYTGKLQY